MSRNPFFPRPDFEIDEENISEHAWNGSDTSSPNDSAYGTVSNISDHTDSPDLISFSDEEEGERQLFTSTLEEFNQSCFEENASKFKFWIAQTIRKLLMLFSVAQEDKYGRWGGSLRKSELNRRVEYIRSVTKVLKRNNAAGIPYFFLVFELESFFRSCPPSFLIHCPLIVALKELFSN